jgi:RND family efflux transporter MFP subunit
LVIASVILVACGEDEMPPEPVVRPIKILELDGNRDGDVLEFPGTIAAGRRAELGFEVAGRIIELVVREGQEVDEGMVLARLDAADFQFQLDAELAKEAAAEAEYQRTLTLFKENVTSKQALETRKRDYDVAKTGAKLARKAFEDTALRAPFAGVVARVVSENFETVQAKQTILKLENSQTFEVTADIPEQDAARMEAGVSLEERTRRTRPTVSINALDGREFDARLTEFATTADPNTRTFAATLSFPNPGDVSLASGMTANVRFHVSAERAAEAGILVPSVAVAANPAGESIVWVIDRDTMASTARKVEVGMLSEGRIRVTQGLSGNEWIAVSGVSFLYDGLVVSRLTE